MLVVLPPVGVLAVVEVVDGDVDEVVWTLDVKRFSKNIRKDKNNTY